MRVHCNSEGLAVHIDPQRWPVISVYTKEEPLVGKYQRAEREGQPQGQPEEVLVHDFIDPAPGKAIPRGVYDVE